MKRVLNYLLAISFILTIMVPITGIIVHKLAATLFLILALIHVFIYRKRLDYKVAPVSRTINKKGLKIK